MAETVVLTADAPVNPSLRERGPGPSVSPWHLLQVWGPPSPWEYLQTNYEGGTVSVATTGSSRTYFWEEALLLGSPSPAPTLPSLLDGATWAGGQMHFLLQKKWVETANLKTGGGRTSLGLRPFECSASCLPFFFFFSRKFYWSRVDSQGWGHFCCTTKQLRSTWTHAHSLPDPVPT